MRTEIVWIRFSHRLEERPFVGIGKTKADVAEDAMRFARFHWGLGDSDMGLKVLSSERVLSRPDPK
jgi:hypothetical protein